MDIINTNQNTNENTNNNNNEIKINKIIFSIKYNTHFGEEVGILGLYMIWKMESKSNILFTME